MRNPKSLCAVALSLALTSPASAAPNNSKNVQFDRTQYLVVVEPKDVIKSIDAKSTVDVRKVCDGTLATTVASLNNVRSSVTCKSQQLPIFGYRTGANCHLDLYCIKMAADGTTPVQIFSNLDLTVYHAPFTSSSEDEFVLNRGGGNPDVGIHPPLGTELTYVAPTEPVTPAKPGEKPKPKPKKPATPTTPVVKKPAADAGTALSRPERGWLTPGERAVYDAATDASKKPAAAALAQAYKEARTDVARNLRPESQAGYQSLVAAGTFDKIDDYLATVKHYTGLEVALSAAERDTLLTVLKSSVAHTDFIYPNAQAEYDSQMKPILTSAGVPALSAHVRAHQIVVLFRPMTVAPPATSGQAPDGSPAMLTDADFMKVPVQTDRDALHKKYNDAWAKTVTNDDKNALNKDYLAQIAALAAAGTPGGTTHPTTPMDPSAIKTLDDLKKRTPDEQKQFCSMLSSDGGAAGSCGDILANGLSATEYCTKKYPNVTGTDQKDTSAKMTVVLQNRNACQAQVNACKPQTTATSSTTVNSSSLPKDLRDYCAALLANATTPPVTPNIGGTVPPSPGSAPGDDKGPKTPEDKKPDPNFTTNLGNGIAFGIGGLLLASFFLGPIGMLAVGLVCGVGAYYASKSITEPPDPSKKKDSGSGGSGGGSFF